MKAVIDTNILVSALKSRRGASNEVMKFLAHGKFKTVISTALLLEYEDVFTRPGLITDYTTSEINEYLDSFCALAQECYIYFRWRPFLPDPKDDLVFECALASGAQYIITHNIKDFPNVNSMGVSVVTPAQFLSILRS